MKYVCLRQQNCLNEKKTFSTDGGSHEKPGDHYQRHAGADP